MEDLETIYENQIRQGRTDPALNNMYMDRPQEQSVLAKWKEKYGNTPRHEEDIPEEDEEMSESEEALISDRIIKHIKGLRKIARSEGIGEGSRIYYRARKIEELAQQLKNAHQL